MTNKPLKVGIAGLGTVGVALLKVLRDNARSDFLQKYTSESNYYRLISIYRNVIAQNKKSKSTL